MESSNEKYTGSLTQGKRHGQGMLFLGGVRVYEGYWKDDLRHGEGKEYREGDLVFEGIWNKGVPWTGSGKVFSEDKKSEFRGEIREGKRLKGSLITEGNLIYEGEFKCDGLARNDFNGKGKLYKNNKLIFEGLFLSGNIWEGEGKVFDNNDQMVYEGQHKGGLHHGKGIRIYSNEERYEGEFLAGNRHGYGRYFIAGQLVYQGNWNAGRKSGHGIAFRRDQLIFDGEWANNRYWNGKGKLFLEDILQIEGVWQNGLLQGLCREYCPFTGKLIFVGEFRAGERDGDGTQFDPATERIVFEGKWVNGLRWSGKSIEEKEGRVVEQVWSQGHVLSVKEFEQGVLIFEGEYHENKRVRGIEYNNNRAVYRGGFLGPLRHGEGIVFDNEYPLGYPCRFNLGYRYEGDVVNDYANGFGTLYENGEAIYCGNFKDGIKHGQGNDRCSDGSWYEGYFREGKRDGKGLEVLPDGEMYEGDWKQNMRSGQGVVILPNGISYRGTWKDGLRDGEGIEYEGNIIKSQGIWSNGILNDINDDCPICAEPYAKKQRINICDDIRHQQCSNCASKLTRCPICRERSN